MKGFFKRITDFFNAVSEKDRIAGRAIDLLRNDREWWTEFDEPSRPYEGMRCLRFEMTDRPEYGMVVAMEVFRCIIALADGREYHYGPMVNAELIKAFFPQTERMAMELSKRGSSQPGTSSF